MQQRRLGNSGAMVSALGLGCMPMSEFYGPHDEGESIATIRRALDLGCSHLDTADMYGRGHNEELVGRAIRGRRDEVFLATKFGIVRKEGAAREVCGKPEYVHAACQASLRRLGVETIDLYYLHRVDLNTPIEDTVGAMGELVREGKVRFLGLSEVAPKTIRRAAAVHPIAALQNEYSLWTRDLEGEVLETCRELGVALVAFSPLGRGFLTGKIRKPEDLTEGDSRRTYPRFQGENFRRNLKLVDQIERVAAEKSCTAAQLALAWLLAQGEDVLPIPATRSTQRLEENLRAVDVQLTAEDLTRINEIAPPGVATGARYTPEIMAMIGR